MPPYLFHELVSLSSEYVTKIKSVVKNISFGSVTTSRPLLEKMISIYGDSISFNHIYASTESFPISMLMNDDIQKSFHSANKECANRFMSCGKAFPGVSIAVVDQNGKNCSPLELGMIYVKSDYTFKRYFHNENATREAFTGFEPGI